MGFAVHELLAPASLEAVHGRLARRVAFHSPVADYDGQDDVAHLLVAIGRCVTSIRPGQEYLAGTRSVTEFTGNVGAHALDGVLVQQIDSAGLLEEATLLLRPLAALQSAVAMMGEILAAEPLPSQRPT